jgi:transcriptional regulator with XRE-family HTH domain
MEKSYETFGTFLRRMRLRAGYGLRAFALAVGLQPSNLSNIERSKISPPQAADRLRVMAEALGIIEGSAEWQHLFDLAAQYKEGALPADIKEVVSKRKGIPILLRTVDNRKLSEKQLHELTEYVNKHF